MLSSTCKGSIDKYLRRLKQKLVNLWPIRKKSSLTNDNHIKSKHFHNEWKSRFDILKARTFRISTIFSSYFFNALSFRCSARQLDMRKKRRNSGMSSSNESKSPEDTDFTPKKSSVAKFTERPPKWKRVQFLMLPEEATGGGGLVAMLKVKEMEKWWRRR